VSILGSLSPLTPPSSYTRLTIYYNYGASNVPGIGKPTCGITESFYTPTFPINTLESKVLIPYLKYRLALSVSWLQFVYCRYSQVNAYGIPVNSRIVDFSTAQDVPNNRGGFAAPQNSGMPDETALLCRIKLLNGPSARIFLHGLPAVLDDEGYFNPGAISNWTTLFNQFAGQLTAIGTYWYARVQTPNPVTARQPFTGYAPLYPRGATLTPAAGTTQPTVGSFVTIGGTGSQVVGLKGRKVVTAVSATPLAFAIGGSTPIGTLAASGAYYYVDAMNFLSASTSYVRAERLSSHKVGRPFAEPVGRRKNTLALRR